MTLYSRFNPSVGILFIQAQRHSGIRFALHRFNPSVGILFIQANEIGTAQEEMHSFNPSVGILFIQARFIQDDKGILKRFQSLGRDSVHSSLE